MSFPRYQKYKSSGVQWLGDIPEGWHTKRLRFVANLNPLKLEIADLDRRTNVSFLPMEAIGDDGRLSLDNEKTISDLESGYTYFRDGDVTIAKITPCYENGKGALMRDLKNGIGFGTTELIVVRPLPTKIDSRYLNYLFISPIFRDLGESHMYGAGGQKRVPDSFVKNLVIAVPSLAEQSAVAKFLDRETTKIDELVAEQQRLMERLKEKRQAVISHAVTKGLNPHAPMKASGIEWLGNVPEHWNAGRLRRFSRRYSGGTPDKTNLTYWQDGVIPWLNSGAVNDRLILEPSTFITPEAFANSSAKWIPAGALVMALAGQGKTKGMVAQLAIPSTCNQSMAAIVPSPNLDARFLFWWLDSNYQSIRNLAGGDSRDGLNLELVGDIPMPVLPHPEQTAIAEFLDLETAKIDTLTAEAQSFIDLLQERRSALISAAVTGQIDVHEVAGV